MRGRRSVDREREGYVSIALPLGGFKSKNFDGSLENPGLQ